MIVMIINQLYANNDFFIKQIKMDVGFYFPLVIRSLRSFHQIEYIRRRFNSIFSKKNIIAGLGLPSSTINI